MYNGLAAGFIMDGNVLAIIGAVVATVGLTLGVVGWVERKIEQRIKEHERVEKGQHASLLYEVSNLRVLAGHPALDVNAILIQEEKDVA